MEGNGKTSKIPRSVSIPAQEIPSQSMMIEQIWVATEMLKLKMYGDKEKDITGVTDELKSTRKQITDLDEKMTLLLDDRKLRKAIVKIVIAIFSTIGLGKIISEWLLK